MAKKITHARQKPVETPDYYEHITNKPRESDSFSQARDLTEPTDFDTKLKKIICPNCARLEDCSKVEAHQVEIAAIRQAIAEALPEKPNTVDVWGNWHGLSMNRDRTAGAIHALDQVKERLGL